MTPNPHPHCPDYPNPCCCFGPGSDEGRHDGQASPPAAESGTPAPGEVGREALARDVNYLRRWALRATRLIAAGQEARHLDDAANRVRASLLSASPASETPTWQCPWCGEFVSEAEKEQHTCGAGGTPGPGEGDLRGEVDPSCCCDRTTARLVICPAHPEQSHSDLLAALDARRADPEFMAQIKASIEQHRPTLDRLAEGDGAAFDRALGLPPHEWLIAELRARVSHAEAERDAAVEQRTLAEQKVSRVEALCDERDGDVAYSGWATTARIRAALADPKAPR